MSIARPSASAGLLGSDQALCCAFDLAILDLDGVVYIGAEAVPGAADAIGAAAKAGLRPCYVTNNASRTPDTVAQHLTSLGVPATVDDVVTSAQVAAVILARRLPPGSRVLVVGGDGLRVALTENGLVPVGTMDEDPAAVVQGFSPDIDWRLLAEGTRAVRAGLPWVASNLDLTVPTAYGPAPGNGALVRLVATATGREPDEVAGKPMPQAFLEAARRYSSHRPLVIGDRLDTDLEGARAAGMPGLAVLTGVSGASDLVRAEPALRPTFIGTDLAALLTPHPVVDVQVADGAATATCDEATVRVTGTSGRSDTPGTPVLTVHHGSDPVDVLRAACAAAWAWTDRDGALPVYDVAPLLESLRRLDAGAAWAR